MDRDALMTFVRSKMFAGIVAGIGITLIAVCVFEAGVAVGYREADFSAHWGANYDRNFGGNGTGMNGIGMDDRQPGAHGTIGKIVSVSPTAIEIVSDQKQEEKVTIGTDTIIRDHENTIQASALMVGTYAVIVGTPDSNGEIDAKLIRIVPNPTTGAPQLPTVNSTTSPFAAP